MTYYQDGENGRKRIGVVFERHMTLPRGPGAARRRRLGLESREMTTLAATTGEEEGKGEQVGRRGIYQMSKRDYMYRETNFEIGRAVENARLKKLQNPKKNRKYKRRDNLKDRNGGILGKRRE